MYRYFYVLFLFATMILTQGAYAAASVPDTLDDDDDTDGLFDDKEWGKWKKDKWNWDMEFDSWHGFDQPAIRVSYGLNRSSVKDFATSFGDVRSLEARIGYANVDPYNNSSYLIDYEFNYFNYYRGAAGIDKRIVSPLRIDAEFLRLGLGWENGIGYRLGESALIPYTSYAFGWTKTKVLSSPGLPLSETDRLNLYHNLYKFTTKSEFGIILQPIRNIAISAAFEKSLIYPRIITWKMAGSYVAEAIGVNLVDEFMDRVVDNSPFVAPILNVALKSAVSYYFFEMRREEMLFPFKGISPLYYEDFKLSANFIF